MTSTEQDLTNRIKALEKELQSALTSKAQEFEYSFASGKARFEKAVLEKHRNLKYRLPSYLLHGRFPGLPDRSDHLFGHRPLPAARSFPDGLSGNLFPGLRNSEGPSSGLHHAFDRGGLKYLNLLERLNCAYCSYGNGVLAYGVEVAARNRAALVSD